MLYNENNNCNEDNFIEKINSRRKLRKKVIICGIIVSVCIVVMIVSVIISINLKNNSLIVDEEIVSKKNNINIYSGNHIQINKHDIEQIKTKFVPKSNPNAQQEIKNLYYSDEKVAYLTFDDGPSKAITPLVLNILKQENVPATFFVLGSRVDLNPDLLQREYNEGHYIANHGYSHQYSQIYASKDTVFEEYAKTENSIRNALNNPDFNTYLFRFPGGSSGGRYASVKSEAKELLANYGISQTNWNCLTGDAEGKTTVESQMQCLQETMQGDGAIIVLMHDASDKTYTAEVLPLVISYLREQGYRFSNFYDIFK